MERMETAADIRPRAEQLLDRYLKRRQSILVILHNDYHVKTTQPVGGTEMHAADLERMCSERYNVIVAARAGKKLGLTVHTAEGTFRLTKEIGETPDAFPFRNRGLREVWEWTAEAFGVSLVHVHHLLGLSLDIFDVCREKGIPLVVSLHDFFAVCPTIKLMDPDNRTCLGAESPEKCRACLAEKCGVKHQPDYLNRWREQWGAALEKADVLITPSGAAKEIIGACYPALKERIRVIPHGTDSAEEVPAGGEAAGHRGLHVGLIGNNTIEKGSLIYREAIPGSGREIRWFAFGNLTPRPERGKVWISGPYQREALPGMLAEKEIDVICMLPVIPETFSYTLSEAWKGGIPVIGTELGAIGERIRETGAGWVLRRDDGAEELLSLLRRIAKHPEELAEKKARAAGVRVRTAAEMGQDYFAVYEGLMRPRACKTELWPEIASLVQEREDEEPAVNQSARELMHLLRAREAELAAIKATRGYRMLEGMRSFYLRLRGRA